MVPLSVMWSRADQRRASGTSLAAILPIALVGAAIYYVGRGKPQVDLAVAFFLVLGSAVGAFAGAHASRKVPESALKILVTVLLAVVGLKELHDVDLGGSALASSEAEPAQGHAVTRSLRPTKPSAIARSRMIQPPVTLRESAAPNGAPINTPTASETVRPRLPP